MGYEDRPVTPDGAKKWKAAAQGLAAILDPPGALLTSPLLRARQTAEIAGQAWGGLDPRKPDDLAGGSFDALAAEVDSYRARVLVVAVGRVTSAPCLLARHVAPPSHPPRGIQIRR